MKSYKTGYLQAKSSVKIDAMAKVIIGNPSSNTVIYWKAEGIQPHASWSNAIEILPQQFIEMDYGYLQLLERSSKMLSQHTIEVVDAVSPTGEEIDVQDVYKSFGIEYTDAEEVAELGLGAFKTKWQSLGKFEKRSVVQLLMQNYEESDRGIIKKLQFIDNMSDTDFLEQVEDKAE